MENSPGISKFSKLVSPAVLLYLYVGLMQLANGIYLAARIEPPPGFNLVDFFGLLWILGWWLLTDSRKRGLAWVYDIGFFLTIAWPFIMPYYLFKTRGARGLLSILAFIGVYVGGFVVGVALGVLL